MCFAPQGRALLQHLNFQRPSEPEVLCTCSLPNVLRATKASTFSTSQLSKALRSWGVLYFFTSKCASCHNGVQFFISYLRRCLRTRRFSEPTFRPPGATNIGKTVFRDFPTFSRTCIFPFLTFCISHLLHVGASAELWCFSICPYCRKFSFQTSFNHSQHFSSGMRNREQFSGSTTQHDHAGQLCCFPPLTGWHCSAVTWNTT